MMYGNINGYILIYRHLQKCLYKGLCHKLSTNLMNCLCLKVIQMVYGNIDDY